MYEGIVKILSNGYAYEVKMHSRQDIYETKQNKGKYAFELSTINFYFYFLHASILLRLFLPLVCTYLNIKVKNNGVLVMYENKSY